MSICLRDGPSRTSKDNNWYHIHIALSCIRFTCVDVKCWIGVKYVILMWMLHLWYLWLIIFESWIIEQCCICNHVNCVRICWIHDYVKCDEFNWCMYVMHYLLLYISIMMWILTLLLKWCFIRHRSVIKDSGACCTPKFSLPFFKYKLIQGSQTLKTTQRMIRWILLLRSSLKLGFWFSQGKMDF